MRVLTLDTEAFDRHVSALADAITAHGRHYDLVVAIANGGIKVGESLMTHLGLNPSDLRIVAARRPSTRHKHGALMRCISHLPLWVLDILRKAESWVLAHRDHTKHLSDIAVTIDPAIVDYHPRSILLVDDAIDSGATALRVIDTLRSALPDVHIDMAVLTVTTSRPLVMPQFTIYSDRTLLRTPWAKDAKH